MKLLDKIQVFKKNSLTFFGYFIILFIISSLIFATVVLMNANGFFLTRKEQLENILLSDTRSDDENFAVIEEISEFMKIPTFENDFEEVTEILTTSTVESTTQPSSTTELSVDNDSTVDNITHDVVETSTVLYSTEHDLDEATTIFTESDSVILKELQVPIEVDTNEDVSNITDINEKNSSEVMSMDSSVEGPIDEEDKEYSPYDKSLFAEFDDLGLSDPSVHEADLSNETSDNEPQIEFDFGPDIEQDYSFDDEEDTNTDSYDWQFGDDSQTDQTDQTDDESLNPINGEMEDVSSQRKYSFFRPYQRPSLFKPLPYAKSDKLFKFSPLLQAAASDDFTTYADHEPDDLHEPYPPSDDYMSYMMRKLQPVKNSKRDIESMLLPPLPTQTSLSDRLRSHAQKPGRYSKALERLVHFVGIVGHVDSLISTKMKTYMSKLARLWEDDVSLSGL